MKKIILTIMAFAIIAIGGLFAINGKDNYDASKYSVTATNGINIESQLSLTLPDQFDRAYSLGSDTKKIIFVFAKATGHTVKSFLSKQDKEYLNSRNTLFVADVSPMPTVIRNTFALPDLRKSEYSVLLIYDKEIAKTLKNEEKSDKIAVAEIENKTIKSIQYLSTEDELIKALN
jgi:hypothetical protein